MTLDELAERLAALDLLWQEIQVMQLRGSIESFELQREVADGRLSDH